MKISTASVLFLVVVVCSFGQGHAKRKKCGKERIDTKTHICCNKFPHIKSWLNDTECCGQYAYNPNLESCCNGMVNPGYGVDNSEGQCCGPFGYDRRCYQCKRKKKQIVPKFDYRHEICCDGNIQELLKKSCCCGGEVFDPTKLICCEGKIVKRPKDMPGDCCNCGLTLVDIVIVLDSSESIGADNWPKMLDFAISILAEADIDNDNVRVGMLTYRHNTTEEFHLDTFHNKKKMFAKIRSTRYVRGSTNTGMALEMMRTEMFDTRRGDRPNVDNVCIVITDGDSDEYKYTIDQAKKGRDTNIHIFAIGIALKNTTELKNIASPPPEQNVLSIDDFAHLESLQGKIFASICTGQPIPKIHEPCGDDYYNPLNEICCDGNPQPMLMEGKTPCCGQHSYDPSKAICCEDKVNVRKNGNKTVCCGDTSLHPELEMCCDGQAIPRSSAEFSQCCDIYAYNPKTEVCCEGYVSKAYGDPKTDTACCFDFSYDTRCYDCLKGRLRPLFDPECQICCDGTIHNMTVGASCCCGKDIFKPDKTICCNGKLRKRKKDEKKHDCCECGSALVDIVIVLDSSESILVKNWELLKKFLIKLIKNSDIDSGSTRFGLVTYRHNVTNEFFLNRYLRSFNMIDYVKDLPYVRGSTNTGGGIEMMWKDMFTTKNGDRPGVPNIGLVITDGFSDEPAYTKEQAMTAKSDGIHVYAIGVGLDKTQELKDIASQPWEDNVFTSSSFSDLDDLESKLFSVISDVCPQVPKKKLKKPCGEDGEMYDPATEVCCDGQPQPIYGTVNNTACCGDKSYNMQEQMCCAETINRKPHKTRSVCCVAEAYDPSDAICCYNTTVVPKHDQASKCCGLETYNPVKELCCDDVLFENYGPDGCCGDCCIIKNGSKTVSYDTRCYSCEDGELVPLYDCAYQRCCDGVIQEITSMTSCCCGKVAFDPTDKICCNEKLRPRTEDDDEECCECARNLLDIGIVLDSSESVGLTNWKLMEIFVEDLIEEASLPNVRFGLVTYRHNITKHFNLNQYFDKKALAQAVDTLPYVRGSTNTGGGLEMMRKEIFNYKNGDRPSATNFGLLVTDGDSDDFDDTIHQAQLAKKQGIHIIALGVGLKNVTELRAVASPPPEENAINLKDFKELQRVKDQIFGDMAGHVCPQMPKLRCKTPCGNSSIDEKMEMCCHGNPQPMYAGPMETMCCDTIAYDPDCFICCEDYTLVSRFAGEYTECCCRFAYDSRSHICCGNQILPKVADDFTACCHNSSYDTRSQVCCDYVSVQPIYGNEKSTQCCGGISYDARCFECKNNRTIVPSYDQRTQLCCDGVIQDKLYEDRSCCCGKEQFDVKTHICCDETLIERPEGPEVVCCGATIYNPKEEICCNNTVDERMNGYETCCCGNVSYHPKQYHCCQDKLSKKETPKDTCCCEDVVFNVNTEICCEGIVQELINPNDRKGTICCGKKAFSPKTHICCGKKLYELLEDTNTVCCGNKAYNGETEICVNEKIQPLTGVCYRTKYNVNKQMCCNGWLNNITANDYTRCCFDRAYDSRKYVCCCNGHLQEAFAGIYTQCCYSFGYDSRTHICCDGQVTRKTYPSAKCCCERQSYDSEREICCKGKVKSRCVGLFTKCCDTEAYDPGYKICCAGKLYNRIYGHNTYCCGKEIYTPMMAACCGKRIAYRRKLKIEW